MGRGFFRGLVILSALAALTACEVVPQHKIARPGYVTQPRKIVVATGLSSEDVALNPSAFRQAMERRLRACGIEAVSVGKDITYNRSGLLLFLIGLDWRGPDQIYSIQNAVADAAPYKPDAILHIAETDSQTAYGYSSYQELKRDYKVQYYDVPLRSIVWSADLQMPGGRFFVYTKEEKRENLLRMVLSSLAKDGILRNCAPPLDGQQTPPVVKAENKAADAQKRLSYTEAHPTTRTYMPQGSTMAIP